jgi:1-pyrroline-5-carboxylate dehydrogenase
VSLAYLKPFVNELYLDFTIDENRDAMLSEIAAVRQQLGKTYPLLIDGQAVSASDTFSSINPAQPSEIVGIHAKATTQQAAEAVESLHHYFPTWAKTSPEVRAQMLLKAGDLIRLRKLEFNAWLCLEAGKTWPEAEAEVAEAIDFCEYYARHALKLANPEPVVQLPGERDEMVYLPLGVGVVIPPWNFAFAILCGMTVAALVTGNTVAIKPSSETPTIAYKFAEVLLEAGFPPESFAFLTGSGGEMGDALTLHPLTRFISFTGSRDVGLRIVELAAKPQKGLRWIRRVVAEMGGKDAIIVDHETDLEVAAQGVVVSAFGFQGQKCSACSRAIVDQKVYEEFVAKVVEKTKAISVGSPEKPSNYMGPVISDRALKSILNYIEIGRTEGRLLVGGQRLPGDGYFLAPTVIVDVAASARIFQEEIFGPVLAISKARDFDHALELANDSEYGLTGAVYSNNRDKLERAKEQFFVGNLYLNRKCTGAMVGAHPFGGFNMSGTDSKAGGPDYLLQFVQAKSLAEKL